MALLLMDNRGRGRGLFEAPSPTPVPAPAPATTPTPTPVVSKLIEFIMAKPAEVEERQQMLRHMAKKQQTVLGIMLTEELVQAALDSTKVPSPVVDTGSEEKWDAATWKDWENCSKDDANWSKDVRQDDRSGGDSWSGSGWGATGDDWKASGKTTAATGDDWKASGKTWWEHDDRTAPPAAEPVPAKKVDRTAPPAAEPVPAKKVDPPAPTYAAQWDEEEVVRLVEFLRQTQDVEQAKRVMRHPSQSPVKSAGATDEAIRRFDVEVLKKNYQ